MIYSLLVSAISVVASQSCEQIDKVNGFIGTGGIAYCLHVAMSTNKTTMQVWDMAMEV
jgi:hypothetical protein